VGLKEYVIRRLITAIPTLLAISLITFAIVHLAPGDPLQFFLALNPNTPPWMVEFLKMKYGLNRPLWEQYTKWLWMLLTGDLGYSYVSGEPVSFMISVRVWNTLKLTLTSEAIALSIAIPLGVISAVKSNSVVDHGSRVLALMGVSMPVFWLSLLLIYVFSLWLGIFPTFGAATVGKEYSSIFEQWADELWHLALPALALGLVRTAFLTRLVRGSVIGELQSDYVLTARMKGLSEKVVIYKHVLRNALLPVVTVVGLSMGFMLSGAVLTETVFAWPGMGRLAWWATLTRDYPVLMAITVIVASLVVVFNLVTDVIYALIDPRIKY